MTSLEGSRHDISVNNALNMGFTSSKGFDLTCSHEASPDKPGNSSLSAIRIYFDGLQHV